jgi:hypothetical protein
MTEEKKYKPVPFKFITVTKFKTNLVEELRKLYKDKISFIRRTNSKGI